MGDGVLGDVTIEKMADGRPPESILQGHTTGRCVPRGVASTEYWLASSMNKLLISFLSKLNYIDHLESTYLMNRIE